MPTTTIQVKSVRQPDKFPKYGSVQDASGTFWSVPAGILSQFAENSPATVEYETTQKGDKTYRNITKMIVGGAAPVSPRATGPSYDEKRSEDIAVLAIVKEWVGKIPVGDTEGLVHALRVARVAWRNSAVIKQMPSKIETGRQTEAEFDDSIPDFPGDR